MHTDSIIVYNMPHVERLKQHLTWIQLSPWLPIYTRGAFCCHSIIMRSGDRVELHDGKRNKHRRQTAEESLVKHSTFVGCLVTRPNEHNYISCPTRHVHGRNVEGQSAWERWTGGRAARTKSEAIYLIRYVVGWRKFARPYCRDIRPATINK